MQVGPIGDAEIRNSDKYPAVSRYRMPRVPAVWRYAASLPWGRPRYAGGLRLVRPQTGSTMNGSSEKLPTPFDDGEVYDLILKDIPYGFDFYTGLAKEAKGPVLDVCCGTG